jgi:hypothetical protein
VLVFVSRKEVSRKWGETCGLIFMASGVGIIVVLEDVDILNNTDLGKEPFPVRGLQKDNLTRDSTTRHWVR